MKKILIPVLSFAILFVVALPNNIVAAKSEKSSISSSKSNRSKSATKPTYQSQVGADKKHLIKIVRLGKKVGKSLNRRSQTDCTQDTSALDKLDITLYDYQGNKCTGGTCRVKEGSKQYLTTPVLNYGACKKNFTKNYSYNNPAFGALETYTKGFTNGNKEKLICYKMAPGFMSPNKKRCVVLGKAMGATNTQCNKSYNKPYCTFN